MAQYARSEYSNLYDGQSPNDNRDWGGYQYPDGVPDSLLASRHFELRDDSGSVVTAGNITVRAEIADIAVLLLEIAYHVHGYIPYGSPNPGGDPTWGPWSYENRAIANSGGRPSNHSKGRALDINAPNNSYIDWSTCEIPPGLVRDAQRIGFYWGGFYGDRMHFEYVGLKANVATAEDIARQILAGTTDGGGGAGPIPTTPHDPDTHTPTDPEEDDMPTADEVAKAFLETPIAYQTAVKNPDGSGYVAKRVAPPDPNATVGKLLESTATLTSRLYLDDHPAKDA